MPRSFLVHVPVRTKPLADLLLRSAEAFLEAHGAVTRETLGVFARASRGKDSIEFLVLARFVVSDTVERDAALARAKALEGVLRATLESASTHGNDARVFVAE